jgi:C-terminal processing protease CtpA/Prc
MQTASPFQPNRIDLEVLYQLQLHYLDRSFGGVDMKGAFAQAYSRGALTEDEALARANELVQDIGDRYTKIISQEEYAERFGRLRTAVPPDPATELTRTSVTWHTIQRAGTVASHGYLRVDGFNGQTVSDVQVALQALHDAGAVDLVIDLRGNRGGSVDAAVDSAGLFVPGPARPLAIMQVTEAAGTQSTRFSQTKGIWTNPVEVWVDGKTASAAEVFAGALHDLCPPRAELVGARTYGKGLIQGYYPLSNGGALIQTIAQTSTAGGTKIAGGLPPDESRVFRSVAYRSADALNQAEIDEYLRADILNTRVRAQPACSSS